MKLKSNDIGYDPFNPPNTKEVKDTPIGWREEGQKLDGNKIRTELLPIEAMLGTAEVLTFGAEKYAPRNWEKGIAYSRVYGALLRHMMAWWAGEDKDPETGLSHLHHAGCCISFLQTYITREMNEYDDRPLTRDKV